MHILEGSIFYALYKKLLVFYRNSFLSKVVSGIVCAYRHSLVGRCIKATANRESSADHSAFVSVIKKLFNKMDKAAKRFSSAFGRWRKSSLLFTAAEGIIRMSNEKFFPFVFPIFGTGYIIGRVIQNRLMKRDIILFCLSVIAAVLLAFDREKIKLYVKNSLIYKLYLLVLG
ncbi:MAG TPA: hypothetical protein DCE11_05340 [Ruminiclostridium sp.]|jgi:hypothetical protein|nr:hypothetical protein [Clostridiaceae bacterium]HAA25529.1 hypothetical protein [Ruminiclostridium sp.]